MTDQTRRSLLKKILAAPAAASLPSILAACAGPAPNAPAPLPVATAAPLSANGQIENLVILLRENHSYDNYFGGFPGGKGQRSGPRCADETPDPPHYRAAALKGSAADKRGECHYTEADIPRYHALARDYVLCDNYFADHLGPSVPNYFMLMSGESPVVDNPAGVIRGRFAEASIADRLTAKGVSWRNYDGGIALVSMYAKAASSGNIRAPEEFFVDAAGGTLPQVCWVTPSIRDSEHAPYSVRRGEAWTVARINALMRGPQWNRCAILVVYDEWGGFRDHVAPPVLTRDAEGKPLRMGYRVPCLAIGPYAKRGVVSHTLYSHASVLRTIGRLFGTEPMTPFDARANDLLDCFDLGQPPRRPAPLAE